MKRTVLQYSAVCLLVLAYPALAATWRSYDFEDGQDVGGTQVNVDGSRPHAGNFSARCDYYPNGNDGYPLYTWGIRLTMTGNTISTRWYQYWDTDFVLPSNNLKLHKYRYLDEGGIPTGINTTVFTFEDWRPASYSDTHGTWVYADTPIQRGRWYCIEKFVVLNTVGTNDGIYRIYLDGQLVLDYNDWQFRTENLLVNNIEIFGLYHQNPSDPQGPQGSFSTWIDDVVIADHYIGPLAGPTQPDAPKNLNVNILPPAP